MPTLGVPVLLATFYMTKDGSQEKVKDGGRLAKISDTNTS